MNYLSVCSGICAPTLAWSALGWTCVGFSEIDPFACLVLKERYPTIPNLGDLTLHENWTVGSINALVGGTPCQPFSIAGLRAGLDDHRGQLALSFLQLAARLRPRWVVWENVPGVMQNDGGRAFGTLLGGLEKLGFGWAYRVLDSQHFGLAQQRKRVFVVGCLGGWRPAAAVLFNRDGLSWAARPRKGSRAHAPGHAQADSGIGVVPFDTNQITSAENRSRPEDGNPSPTLCAEGKAPAVAYSAWRDQSGEVTAAETDVAPALCARKSSRALSATVVAYNVHWTREREGRLEAREADTAATLTASEGERTGTGTKVVAYGFQSRIVRNGRGDMGEVAHALTADAGGQNGDSRPLVAVSSGVTIHGTDKTRKVASEADVLVSLTTKTPGGIANSSTTAALTGDRIRRLTPVECERLQGFPDHFTLVEVPGARKRTGRDLKESIAYLEAHGCPPDLIPRLVHCPDSPRYRVLGNSISVPVIRWIGERIAFVDSTL